MTLRMLGSVTQMITTKCAQANDTACWL